MNSKIVAKLYRAGSPIITTLTSLAVTPPVIRSPQSKVNWTTFAVLFAGVLSIFIYDFLKKRAKAISLVLILLISELMALAGYEFLANKYTVTSFDSNRVVISTGPVKESAKPNQDYWIQHSRNPVESIVKAHRGDSTEIWELSQLNLQYYALLTVYFLNVVLLTSLLIFTFDKINKGR